MVKKDFVLASRSSTTSKSGRSLDSFLRFMGLSCSGDTYQKGNKGRGAQQRRLKFLGIILVVLVCVLGVAHLCFPSQAHQVMRHAKKLRQSIPAPRKSGGARRSDFTRHELMDLIVAGKLNLVDLEFEQSELARADEDSYEGVYGIFCKLNFQVHKDDPSAVPMFRDIVGKSPSCDAEFNPERGGDILGDDEEDLPRGRVRVNLKHIREMAQKADDRNRFPETHNLALGGVAFHESRCGSTLVANSLIAMNPDKNRVYSESAPPLAALHLCSQALEGDEEDEGPCSILQGAQVLRDVIFFMGRSQDPAEEHFFFKIQSAGTRYLSIFRQAFPATPWIFVYRDPVQVMMSHFAHGKKSANCLRSMHRPPRLLQLLAQKRGYDAGGEKDDEMDATNLQEMSAEDYCAAHLATLTETAATHIQDSNGLGRAVNYVNLPQILYEEILPAWGITVSSEEIQNIQAISGQYSKGRGNQKKEWHEDSEKKEQMASPEIQEASKIFLQESFDALEQIAKAA